MTLKKDKQTVLKSIFTAYFILLLHVVLLAGVGLSVLLFKGFYHYLPWIVGGSSILVLMIAWAIYRKIAANSGQIRDILSYPEFKNRTIEIKLLGGLASFTVKDKKQTPLLSVQDNDLDHNNLLESSIGKTERKMAELIALYEKKLITKDDFESAKQKIIHG